jgi:DNA primase
MKNFTISDIDLRSIIRVNKETRSGQYICDCPFCGKENHMYINRKTQLFDCKKCGVNGSIYKLLKHFDKLYLIGDKSVEYTDVIKSIRQTLEDELAQEQDKIEPLPDRELPVGFRRCLANNYLKERGITRADCKRYNIGETHSVFKYQNYILFPIYDDGKVKGYLGRYASKRVPANKLRYNNSIDTDFASLLYGYDEIIKDKTETVIIVEGVFDKISVDKKLGLINNDEVKCVCTFGKKISDVQIRKLIAKNVSNIVLSWDFDALREIKQYGIELDHYFNTSVAVCTFKKDIDECTQNEVIKVFSDIKPISNFNLDVIGKLKR